MNQERDLSANCLDVDLGAIAFNVRAVRRLVGAGVWMCAALKANAYGFGLEPVARTVIAAGVDGIGVGSPADGVALRNVGVELPILVYAGEPLTQTAVETMVRHCLIATVHDARTLRACRRFAKSDLEVMLEVDVGLIRLGFDPEEVPPATAAVRASRQLHLRGIYTHMRVPTDRGVNQVRQQYMRFLQLLTEIDPPPITMAASSRVLDLDPQMALNAVDVGRAIYGLLAGSHGWLGPRLRPVFRALRSRLVAVKTIPRERQNAELQEVTRIGVIPFGIADGIMHVSVGHVLVADRRAPIVGRPSLEHVRIDLSRIPEARIGDEVLLVGRQGTADITTDDLRRAHPDVPESALALQVPEAVARVYRA